MSVRSTGEETRQDPRAEQTKRALLDAAIKLFGKKGYENTSVRDLIEEAGVNLSAINYHFGGKEGLRFAAIDHLACLYRTEGPGADLKALTAEKIENLSAEEARSMLRKIMRNAFVRAGQKQFVDDKARYIQRELIQGGKPTELFYEKVFKIQFGAMRLLVARITGEDPDSQTVKIRAINLIAQSVFLNLARPVVLLAMDWESYEGDNADLVADSFWLYHE